MGKSKQTGKGLFVASSTADIYTKLIINAALYTCQFVLIEPCDQHMITFCFIQKKAS